MNTIPHITIQMQNMRISNHTKPGATITPEPKQ